MDALLFLLLLISFVYIYRGQKKPALISFASAMLLYVFWFSYHATDSININL